MKNFLFKFLVVFTFMSGFNSLATHNRAGEIQYKRIPPYNTTFSGVAIPVFNYSITIIKYFDDGPGVVDRCVDTVYFGDGTKAGAPRVNGTVGCNCNACGEMIVNTSGYKVKKSIFTCTHLYSSPGNYLISSTDPNRTSGIFNIPNSDQVAFSIQAMVVIHPNTGINSSPILTNPPIYFGHLQECYVFNCAAFDPDGDSLSYQMVPCNMAPDMPATGYFDPSGGPNGSFSIDPVSGTLTWCKPQLSSAYNIAIRIREWRSSGCGAPRQLIGYTTRDMEVMIGVPFHTLTIAPTFTNACVVAGTNYSQNFTSAITPTTTYSVTLYGYSNYSGVQPLSSVSPVSGTSNLTTTFNWQTSCAHLQNKPHNIHLVYAFEYTGIYRTFTLKVLPPAPVLNNLLIDTGKVTLNWSPPPGCNSEITGYNIYRKTGQNAWSPGNCETGAPPNSGFMFLGSVNVATTTFTDKDFYSVPSGSTGNYFVTATTKDCNESYAGNIMTSTIIVGLREMKWLSGNSIYPNPFQNELSIDFTSPLPENSEVRIYASDGKLVFKDVIKSGELKSVAELNSLQSGIYLLQLKSSNTVVSHKILKE